jgi:hypothetical protein
MEQEVRDCPGHPRINGSGLYFGGRGAGEWARRTAVSNLAEISSARRCMRRLPVWRHALAAIETAVSLGGPVSLIAPSLKIGLGSLR